MPWRGRLSMSILNSLFGLNADDMAKRKPINEDLVREYVDRFTKAQTNRSTFERIFAELKEDEAGQSHLRRQWPSPPSPSASSRSCASTPRTRSPRRRALGERGNSSLAAGPIALTSSFHPDHEAGRVRAAGNAIGPVGAQYVGPALARGLDARDQAAPARVHVRDNRRTPAV